MSSSDWAWVIFAALAVVIWASVELGRQAERGRGEQERGDLAEQLTAALIRNRELEQRCERQGAHIRALTDWEVVEGADTALPGLLRTVPMPRAAAAENLGGIHRRPAGRRGQVAEPAGAAAVPAVAAVGEPVQDAHGADATSWDGWAGIMSLCAEGRAWAASLCAGKPRKRAPTSGQQARPCRPTWPSARGARARAAHAPAARASRARP